MIIFFSFLLGTIFASFTGVIITRLREFSRHNLKSVLIGRSHCDSCGKMLDLFQLIPVLGYLLQQGRCKFCHGNIPLRMTVFELTIGIIFALLAYFLPIGPDLYYRSAVSLILCGLLVADILYLEVNIILLLFLLFLIFGYQYSLGILDYTRMRSGSLFLGFLGIYLIGLLVAKRKFGRRQEGFGFGDVLLSIPIGLLLGQMLGNLELFDRLWWLNIYVLIASIAMLIYILIMKQFQKSGEHYFPFVVGMICSLVILSLRRISFG